MGTKYPGVSVTGYNASPPSDDGTQSEANKVKWSTIKSKLSDAVKTALEAMDTALQAALSYATNTQATNYTTLAADHDKIIQVTASATITALLAATGGAGYRFGVYNGHSAAITVARSGSDTFPGAATSFSIAPGQLVWFYANASTNGYLVSIGISGGVGGEAKRAAVYQYTAWDPSDLVGTATNASSTAAASNTAASYVTQANSSGTLTNTAVIAGLFRFTVSGQNEYNQALTNVVLNAVIGGTATIYLGTTTLQVMAGTGSGSQPLGGTGVFYAAMTVGQTVTILPQLRVTAGGATTNWTQQCTVSAEYVGAT